MSDRSAALLAGLTMVSVGLLIGAFVLWPVPMFKGLMFTAAGIFVAYVWCFLFETFKGRT